MEDIFLNWYYNNNVQGIHGSVLKNCYAWWASILYFTWVVDEYCRVTYTRITYFARLETDSGIVIWPCRNTWTHWFGCRQCCSAWVSLTWSPSIHPFDAFWVAGIICLEIVSIPLASTIGKFLAFSCSLVKVITLSRVNARTLWLIKIWQIVKKIKNNVSFYHLAIIHCSFTWKMFLTISR